MNAANSIGLFVLCAGLAYLAIRAGIAITTRSPGLLADLPNARSLHTDARPRIGGIGLLGAAMAGLSMFAPSIPIGASWTWILIGCTAALFALSLADDFVHLAHWTRLLCHVGVAFVFLWCVGGQVRAPWVDAAWPMVVAAAGMVWWTNLNNFMDGADGLAGGMGLIGLTSLGWVALFDHHANVDVASFALALSGACAGFLLTNFPPARVFMGDAGSIPLGFLAAALSWLGTIEGLWPWWYGPAVFSVFIVDATVTLVRRMIAGKRFWLAHREHYYQRLILSGWSHRKTCLVYYFLMLLSAICALSAKNSPHPWTWLLPLVITYASLIAVLEWRFHQEKEHGKKSGTG